MKRIITMLFALFLVLLLVPARAEGAEIIDSGNCGENLTWILTEDGTLSISGVGDMDNYNLIEEIPWYAKRDIIISLIIDNCVTSIGERAFWGCTNLLSVTLSENITSIKNSAFVDCSSLRDIVIPNSVTLIEQSAFSGCSDLSSVMLSGSISRIEDTAFYSCSSLLGIDIPNSVTVIGERVFENCVGLTSVVLSDNITEIGYSTFRNCSNLRNIVIPDKVTFIGESAFSQCTNLTSISIPESVIKIGPWAFSNCSSLTSVMFGYGVTTIAYGAFSYCTSLINAVLPESVTKIEGTAFINCRSLSNFVLPDSVTVIDESAFSDCYNLGNIVFPENINTIGNFAFSNCSNLENITFCGDSPDIGPNAFYYVTASSLYPANNDTWTMEERQSYGGKISWISYIPCVHDYFVETTVSPTCTTRGYTTYICTLCGKVRTEYADFLGHSYINGACQMCGYVPYLVDSGSCGDTANWMLLSDGTLMISGCGVMTNYWHSANDSRFSPWHNNRGNIRTVVIEEGITSVGDYSFADCPVLCNVSLPTTVTSIGTSAFYQCTNLIDIVFPEAIVSIGENAFSYCSSLSSVEIPDSVTSLNDVFSYCYKLESVKLPKNLMEMHETFSYCYSLKSVEIPDGVSSLVRTFTRCEDLESIEWPENLIEIGEYAFSGCISLATVEIPDGVVLIGDNAFSLCKFSTVTIPDSVQVIGSSGFLGCDELINVDIPYGVESIWMNTFQDCSKLQSISIPISVGCIEAGAFLDCDLLECVYYSGDEDQWNNIVKCTDELEFVELRYLDIATEGYVNTVENDVYLTEGGQPDLIDRFVLSPFAKKFYNWLEESTDGDKTDDDLIFDISEGAGIWKYTYRDQITINSENIEELIVKLAREEHALANNSIPLVYNIFRQEHPEVFWFGNTYAVGYSSTRKSNTVGMIEISLDVYHTGIEKAKYYELVAQKEQTICDITSMIPEDADILDKVRYFNAYLTRNNCYNSTYPNESSTAHDAITALVGGVGVDGPVCEAYARAFKVLCETQDIPCAYITGTSNGESHAWNLVQMEDNKWYAVDVTWNDPSVPDVTMPVSGYENEDYLLVGKETIIQNKSFSESYDESIQEHVTNLYIPLPKGPVINETEYSSEGDSEHIAVLDDAVNPTCTKAGLTARRYCYICEETLSAQEEIPALGHDMGEWMTETEATCTEDGVERRDCSRCDHSEAQAIPAPGHDYDSVVTAPTCTEQGYTTQICECGESYVDTYVDALGHDWQEADCETPKTCARCGETEGEALGHTFEDGSCIRCGEEDPDWEEPTEPTEPSEPEDPVIEGTNRLAGSNRYETGFAVANQLKANLGIDQFETVIVAYGQNFPDALTGSYLAAVKNAPILLTEPSQDAELLMYLRENLIPGGKVYILGGTSAVSQAFEDGAINFGFDVTRLKGADRYETNLAILAEAGVNTTDEILIATGKNYADSLSASATGLPMLLVDKTLTEDQKAFLETTSKNFVILGGTSAVSAEIEAELAEIGTVIRVMGSSRYETSVEIAKRYFENPQAAVLAYAQGFPDGLCGGPLALSMGAPLILTSNSNYAAADDYIEGITSGAVTGGTARITDDTVRKIFDLPDDAPIVNP